MPSVYADVEVITSQVATVRHPRWGREMPVDLAGASYMLLADGTEIVVCDTCGFNGLTGHKPYVKPISEYKDVMSQADSVMSHMNVTHLRTKEPRPVYSDDQLKVVIKAYLKWRAIGRANKIRNWSQCAVDELEALGLKPYRGERWNTSQFGGLARTYLADPKFHHIKQAALSEVMKEAIREAKTKSGRKPTLANPVRITVAVKDQSEPQTIEKEAAVAATTADPILVFGNEVTTKPAPVQLEKPPVIPQQQTYPQHPITLTAPPVDKLVIESAYQHVTEQDGEPVFVYNGVLMVGKPVRKFEI